MVLELIAGDSNTRRAREAEFRGPENASFRSRPERRLQAAEKEICPAPAPSRVLPIESLAWYVYNINR